MFGHYFYHGSIRRYITLFGTLFNEIYINRTTSDNDVKSIMRVPITYGPKDKVLVRVEGDPDLNRPYAVFLPYMSFELNSFTYNPERKLNTLGRIHKPNSSNKNLSNNVYNPVPYDMNFTLNIMVKNAEDGAKILEQILPFFTPDWTTTIRIIDEPEIILDVQLILNNITSQDTWEGNFENRRTLTWTLTFTMYGALYGPEMKSKVIKVAKTNIDYARVSYDKLTGNPSDRTIEGTVTVKPGLTANGEPTSNSAISVPYSDIDWNDDYGFIVEREDGNYNE